MRKKAAGTTRTGQREPIQPREVPEGTICCGEKERREEEEVAVTKRECCWQQHLLLDSVSKEGSILPCTAARFLFFFCEVGSDTILKERSENNLINSQSGITKGLYRLTTKIDLPSIITNH